MPNTDSPLEFSETLSNRLGIELLMKRDDLLPFPLAGNKVRKLRTELDDHIANFDVVISNGALNSNHCRTLAILGAQRGIHVHLVLHGTPDDTTPLKLFDLLGATYDVVPPHDIQRTIHAAEVHYTQTKRTVHTIAGGCHTPSGARSFRHAAEDLLTRCTPDFILVASGTGGTQGGIAAAVARHARTTKVLGVSVARTQERGAAAVSEAANWAGAPNAEVDFLDHYRDGGYGIAGQRTKSAVEIGWRNGLPLDPTYTGKAFAALLDLTAKGDIFQGARVLFWHTGGLWNSITSLYNDQGDRYDDSHGHTPTIGTAPP